MPSQPRVRLKLIVISLALLYSGLSRASEDVMVNPITPGSLPALSATDNVNGNVFFPLYPRLNITGGIGNNNFGRADVMAPLFGSTSAIFYTDLEGQTGKGKSNFLSLGFGARDAVNDNLMWGGYAFIDRSKANDTDGANHWTVINPGIEFMTNHWDGRINGYIPTGNKQLVRGPFFGDQVNQPNAEHFTAHDQFSRIFNKVDEIGPGIDVDAGYTFTSLRRFRVHGGGYHYNLSDTGNITGGEVGIEMPVNNYLTFQLDNTYDDVQKNTTVFGVRFTLGGIDKFANDPTVQDRILDPVYRHFGALRTNTGIPSHHELVETDSSPVLERNNVWFFNANSGVAFNPAAGNDNCTFEHPCIGTSYNQNNINTINGISPNANFFFTPGTYTFDAPKILNLNDGQSMFGRDGDYRLAASSASGFPTFIGELDPKGNNTLDSFALINNNGSQPIGIHVLNANNVFMNNLQIGQMNSQGGYLTSIQLDNANNVTVQNSTIQSTISAAEATILTANNSSVTFNNNLNNTLNNTTGNAVGILANGNSTITANNNNFTVNAPNGDVDGLETDTGSATINATGNAFTLSTNTGAIFGVRVLNTGAMTLNNNIFNLTSNSGNSFGIQNANGNITSTSNMFTQTSTSGVIKGISNSNTGTVTTNDNTFNLTSTSGNITGISNTGSGTVTTNTSKFNLTSSGPMNGIIKVGAVNGSNNTFNFMGAGTKTCGTFTSGSGNTFNNCT